MFTRQNYSIMGGTTYTLDSLPHFEGTILVVIDQRQFRQLELVSNDA